MKVRCNIILKKILKCIIIDHIYAYNGLLRPELLKAESYNRVNARVKPQMIDDWCVIASPTDS